MIRFAHPTQPVPPKKRRLQLSIRTQLMLFLCAISLLLLLLVWFLAAQLLQPVYNRHIYRNLNTQANTLITLMDTAIADGQALSKRRYDGSLAVNSEFWGANGPVEQAIQNGQLSLAGICLDISDSTLRYVAYTENLYPCLMHEGTLNSFGAAAQFSRDSSTAIRLRQQCFAKGRLYRTIETASGTRQMVVGRTTADGSYVVLLSANLTRVSEASGVLAALLPMIALLLFGCALVAAWLFSRWFTRPLTRLSAAARQMAQGNYDVRVQGDVRTDELGALAQDFNHMAAEVQHAAQMQRELLANVSHDLRTPLTLIKGYAETVRDLTGEDKACRDEQMNIVIDETDRLSALVNSVMELTKVASGAEKCEPVQFDMAQLCEEVADRYADVCAQNGWTLQLQLPEQQPLPVFADPAMIERALHNLLGNAMHHIGPDGQFILRAFAAEGGVRVEVADHGPGIAAEELPHLFDRYYRSRADAGKPGTGLGLSITKAIFQQHGCRFGVNSAPGNGTCFWFILKDKA